MDYVERAAAEWRALPIELEEQGGLTASDIRARARAQARVLEAQGVRLDLIVVDYLGLVQSSGRYKGNRSQEVAEISGELRLLAKELDCHVMAAQQLNREVERNDNPRPHMGHLRDSGAIEQDAHVIMFPFRPVYYLQREKPDDPKRVVEWEADVHAVKNDLELIIGKQRHGEMNVTVPLFADPASNAIRDKPREGK